MKVIEARNVHEALPKALRLLDLHGSLRDSRNGPVKVAPWPVTTTYLQPTERVLFWPARDANPFFHLYEAMWMLAGREDVASVARFAKNMRTFSDDGETFHGAYGHRWRQRFGFDQLPYLAGQLRANKDDRRAVLQMWDARLDLGKDGKDFPCNLVTHFQRDKTGRLSMTVFNRSNDILWGAYGANAVHFSVLQEYLAAWIGCEVGAYYQISNNWHAYANNLLDRVAPLAAEAQGDDGGIPRPIPDPYVTGEVVVLPMIGALSIEEFDAHLRLFLAEEAIDFTGPPAYRLAPWFHMLYGLFYAHSLYRSGVGEERYTRPLHALATLRQKVDWVRACTEWIQRRYEAWKVKDSLSPIAVPTMWMPRADSEQV